jgi:hypothetical protein
MYGEGLAAQIAAEFDKRGLPAALAPHETPPRKP